MRASISRFVAIIALIVLGTTAALADESLQRVVSAGSLKVAVAENAPWVIKKPDGTYTGHDVDLVNLLAQDLGVRVQYVELPFASLVPAVSRGEVDMAAAGIAITPERARSVAFSTMTGFQIVNMVADRKAVGSNFAQALRAPGFKIAALARSTDAAAARNAYPQAAVTEYPSEAAALAALLDGNAQAMAGTAPVPRTAATLYDGRLRLIGRTLLRTSAGFALRPDDVRLQTYVNNWIAARLADGTIRQVGRHWFDGQSWLEASQTDAKGAASK